MKYLRVKEDLFLVEQPVPSTPETTKTVPENVNHLWIYDRSWSMSYELKQLASDIVARAKEIPVGDTITLGWFSSEGQRNFILKGFKISADSDWKVLEKAVMSNNSPVGLTCFSEILQDSKQVVEDLSVFSDAFALTFFSDGYPVVSNYSKEIDSIFSAIEAIEGKVAASLMVGYGDYYNKELMAQMAETFGGSLAHCSQLSEFSVSLDAFVKQTQELAPKIEIQLETDTKQDDLVFTVRDGNVAVHAATSENTVKVSPKKRGDLSVFVLSNNVPSGATEVTLTEEVVGRTTKKESLVQGAYAAAFLLTQKTQTGLALEVLGKLGDVALIDSVSNAFTNADYGKSENKLKTAVFSPKGGRLTKGFNQSHLPKEDAFCLVDAMNLLMSDPEAYFFPYHKDFSYKRIGQKSEVREGYPEFTREEFPKCPMNSLTWNSKRLNLSVLARIKGTVKLPEGHEKVGLSENYPTFVWRNFTIVKDGFLNATTLPITASAETIEKLEQEGLVVKTSTDFDSPVTTLDLTRVPVMNREMAKTRTSATELCKKAFEETRLKGIVKALNSVKKELDDGSTEGTVFNEEQQEFLVESGFRKDGSFSPPVDKVEPVDKYFAKEFNIKIKGYSSLPSLKDVRKKVEANKSQTATGALVKEGLDLYQKSVSDSDSVKTKLSTIDDLLSRTKAELFDVRDYIQTTKFAVILGKQWFDEFSSRNENEIEVDGVKYQLELKEVPVAI